MNPSILIAEDEPILAEALSQSLRRLWPEARVVGLVEDGVAAVTETLRLMPDIVFFDINMPGKTGLDALQDLAEEWDGPRPFPLVVFVTAYDQYALEAFEHEAVDYLLKPFDDERLAKTIGRLKQRLLLRPSYDTDVPRLLSQLRAMSGLNHVGTERLTTIRAGSGNEVRLIPVEQVIYFESADKYVQVVTAEREYLIRITLRELILQLNPADFWQIHRSYVVNRKFASSVMRDEFGKLALKLAGVAVTLPVSRMFAHQFRQM